MTFKEVLSYLVSLDTRPDCYYDSVAVVSTKGRWSTDDIDEAVRSFLVNWEDEYQVRTGLIVVPRLGVFTNIQHEEDVWTFYDECVDDEWVLDSKHTLLNILWADYDCEFAPGTKQRIIDRHHKELRAAIGYLYTAF